MTMEFILLTDKSLCNTVT